MERIQARELLDSNSIDVTELRGNLRDLARLNRWTGNTTVVVRAVNNLVSWCRTDARPLSIIDIGTGAGDLTTSLNTWAKRNKLQLCVFGGDLHPSVLDYARQYGNAAHWILLEATHLPLATGSVDIALCTVLAHHLEPDGVQRLLTEMRRVCRVGFIILDLERSRTAHVALWLLTRLISRNRLTRNDGPLSIERAYTRAEIAAIAASVGISLETLPIFPFRWVTTWQAR